MAMPHKRTSAHGPAHRQNKNAQSSTLRVCAWPQCEQEGAYRAPKSRAQLNEYHWYCLPHVRERNKSWNYFAGLNEQEVEAQLRHDTVWNRPTWKMGGIGPRAFDAARRNFSDAFGGFAEDTRTRTRADAPPPPKAPPSQAHALAVLDLDIPLSLSTLKARYKLLVKRHHPDANNGDKQSEEKFKQIVEAYHVIRKNLNETAS